MPVFASAATLQWLIYLFIPHPSPLLKTGRKLFYHISLWKNISRDSNSRIGGQILEIHVSFLCFWALCPWFDIFLSSLFLGALEPSEVKMHIRSVVSFGRESPGALRTNANWARVAPVVCVLSPSTLAGLWVRVLGAWEMIPRRTSWTPSETTSPTKYKMWTPCAACRQFPELAGALEHGPRGRACPYSRSTPASRELCWDSGPGKERRTVQWGTGLTVRP